MGKCIESTELKEVLLGILDKVDSFCRNNNIKYFLYGGTLIGAVRHKGFIPWDDDIDICMLRKDYNKFISSFVDYEGRYELICPEKNSDYYLPMAKVIDNHTEVSERVPGGNNIGVYLDVFPIDNCPGDYREACNFANKLKIFRSVVTIKNLAISKDRSCKKNIELMLLKTLTFWYPRNRAISRINHMATLYQNQETEYVGELTLMPYGEREIYKTQWYNQTTELDFEGRKYMVPTDYHEVLKKCYGDYMLLPPIEKRVTHHGFDAWWR